MAKPPKKIATLTHGAASRKNIPTAEFESVMNPADQDPIQVAYERRNRDLDPQLVWRGKDEQDEAAVVAQAPPLFIQEKVHPKVLMDDLQRQTRKRRTAAEAEDGQPDLFADFNGVPSSEARTEFYQHEANWSNRLILGDSLQVMASLAEREGLRGKVQCIYIDPPYGIKFNSNFQWSTTSRDVKDGKVEHISREPEQVKAFRDTWRDGIHSYLTYLRDRLTVARDLLAESGSVFVQIGDDNVHRVRALLDDVFGEENLITMITFKKTAGLGKGEMAEVSDFILWFAKSKGCAKRRLLFERKNPKEDAAYSVAKVTVGHYRRIAANDRIPADKYARFQILLAAGRTPSCVYPVTAFGGVYSPTAGRSWSTNLEGMRRLISADRVTQAGRTLNYVRFVGDNPVNPISNLWADSASGSGMEKVYVVQTSTKVVQRCILMATDPGDLVLDPTCGSGTTAYIAEQWGRRWITIDTSRVALALARARIMGGRYPYYLLADSAAGQRKEAEINRTAPSEQPTHGDVRQGFVHERVPHVTLKSIANNTEIDVISERWHETLYPLLKGLNAALQESWEEWEIPLDAGEPWPKTATAAWHRLQSETTDTARIAALKEINDALDRSYTLEESPDAPRDPWPAEVTEMHRLWREARTARQQEIDASIAARADVEYLYDRAYDDPDKVRVTGPFTVESVSPHRLLSVNENDELIEYNSRQKQESNPAQDFAAMILGHLHTAGVQQAHKEDRLVFTSLEPWPGDLICAEGRYLEGDTDICSERRAGILVGPEFGTVSRQDLVRGGREAAEAGFDVLIACAFNYEAHATDFDKLGALPVLKARMNADLHMADNLKNTGNGNLFVIFGEPDIEIAPAVGENPESGQIQVKINGVDVFHPNTGEVRSDNADGIACWFIDTDYNDESFFVRHAYFLGASDPYKALRTTLKAEIDADAWATLHSDTSRPFDRPTAGRIAVKVINHLGDEVMKVFRV